jgi:hypothetical protein
MQMFHQAPEAVVIVVTTEEVTAVTAEENKIYAYIARLS